MDTMWSVTHVYNVECHPWIQCGVSPMDTMWSVTHGYNVECHSWIQYGVSSMDTMWSVTHGYNVECHPWIQCGVSPIDTMWRSRNLHGVKHIHNTYALIHNNVTDSYSTSLVSEKPQTTNVVSSTGVSQRELLYHQRAPSFHATRTDYRMLQPFLNTALTPLSSVDGCSSFLNTLFVSLKGTPNTTDEFAIDTISNLLCSSAINCHFGKW